MNIPTQAETGLEWATRQMERLEWYPQVDVAQVAQNGLPKASSTQDLSATHPVRFADDQLRSR